MPACAITARPCARLRGRHSTGPGPGGTRILASLNPKGDPSRPCFFPQNIESSTVQRSPREGTKPGGSVDRGSCGQLGDWARAAPSKPRRQIKGDCRLGGRGRQTASGFAWCGRQGAGHPVEHRFLIPGQASGSASNRRAPGTRHPLVQAVRHQITSKLAARTPRGTPHADASVSDCAVIAIQWFDRLVAKPLFMDKIFPANLLGSVSD